MLLLPLCISLVFFFDYTLRLVGHPNTGFSVVQSECFVCCVEIISFQIYTTSIIFYVTCHGNFSYSNTLYPAPRLWNFSYGYICINFTQHFLGRHMEFFVWTILIKLKVNTVYFMLNTPPPSTPF